MNLEIHFNIALERVIRGAVLDNDIRGTIFYRTLQFLGFANDASSGPYLAVCSSMERGGEGWITCACWVVRWTEHPDSGESWQDTMAGHVMSLPNSCPTKKVFDSDPQLDQVKWDLLEIWCLHGWEAAVKDLSSSIKIVERVLLLRRFLSWVD